MAGCRIVFSRVFPVSEVNPHLHPLWQTAEQFGAVCTIQLDDQVTHVVANSPGTDKVTRQCSDISLEAYSFTGLFVSLCCSMRQREGIISVFGACFMSLGITLTVLSR